MSLWQQQPQSSGAVHTNSSAETREKITKQFNVPALKPFSFCFASGPELGFFKKTAAKPPLVFPFQVVPAQSETFTTFI